MHCRGCRRPTLHSKVTQDPQHVIHFLISTFHCGCWLPVWFIFALQASSAASSEPFRCTQCGQAYGQLTPGEIGLVAANEQREREERGKNRRERAAKRNQMMAEAASTVWRQIKSLTKASGPFIVSLPGRADRTLAAIAGDGNTIVHGFLRLLAIAGAALLGFVSLALLISFFR